MLGCYVKGSLFLSSLRKIYNHVYILVGIMKQILSKLESKGKLSQPLIYGQKLKEGEIIHTEAF